MTLTRDDVLGGVATFVEGAHYNLGYTDDLRHKGAGQEYRCVEEPRLSYVDWLYLLDDGGEKRVWQVDGEPLGDLAAAIAALKRLPRLTAEEEAVLQVVPTEPTPLKVVIDFAAVRVRAYRADLAAEHVRGVAHLTLGRLRAKGLVALTPWAYDRRVPICRTGRKWERAG